MFRKLVYLERWHTNNLYIFATLTSSKSWHMENLVLIKTVIYSETLHTENPGIFRTLVIQKPGIFRALAYSEPWYVCNAAIYGTLAYLEAGSYPEPLHIEDHKHIHNTVKHLGFIALPFNGD